MFHEIESNFDQLLRGAQITKIFRILDLICIKFILQDERKLSIHAQCLVRIFDSEDVMVVCSQNLYQRSPDFKKGLFKRFNWHKLGTTMYDYSLNDYQDELLNTKVSSARFVDKDIKIGFANGMRMDILIITTKYEDPRYTENYIIFSEDKNEGHYSV